MKREKSTEIIGNYLMIDISNGFSPGSEGFGDFLISQAIELIKLGQEVNRIELTPDFEPKGSTLDLIDEDRFPNFIELNEY
jgi:hypothetical protein